MQAVKAMISWSVTSLCILAAVLCIMEAQKLRTQPTEKLGDGPKTFDSLWEQNKWKMAGAFANLLTVIVFGALYAYISEILTNWENHR